MERKEKLLAEREKLLEEIGVATEGLRKLSTPERSLQYIKAFFNTGTDEDYRREKKALEEEKIKEKSVRYLAKPWVLRCLMFDYQSDWSFAMSLGSKQIEAALRILDDNGAGSFTSSRLHSWVVKAYAEYQSQAPNEQTDVGRKRKGTNWEYLLEKCQLRFLHGLAGLHRMCKISWTRVDLCEISMTLSAGQLPKNLQHKAVTEVTLEVSKVDDAEQMIAMKARFGDDTSGNFHAYHALHFTLADQTLSSEFIRSLKEFVDLIVRPQIFKHVPQYVGYKVMKDPESAVISLVIVADSSIADVWNLFETEVAASSARSTKMDLFEQLRATVVVHPRLKDLLRRKRICLRGISAAVDAKLDRNLLTVCGLSGHMSGIRTEMHWSSLPEYIDNPLYTAIKSFRDTEKTCRRLKVSSKFWNHFICGQVHVHQAESLFENWVIVATFPSLF